jgi:hypothetical protein
MSRVGCRTVESRPGLQRSGLTARSPAGSCGDRGCRALSGAGEPGGLRDQSLRKTATARPTMVALSPSTGAWSGFCGMSQT